jgi:hypothetical protein
MISTTRPAFVVLICPVVLHARPATLNRHPLKLAAVHDPEVPRIPVNPTLRVAAAGRAEIVNLIFDGHVLDNAVARIATQTELPLMGSAALVLHLTAPVWESCSGAHNTRPGL